ncbi:dimethylarginine dimethylaminohydrolase family protein [Pseudoxanthomonas putridarboris]|uniref:arginine deiminase n=1 Tax=Pseudoxanthomonas putridarboris TaxID=752605 RepID=A0ABU9IZL9_9GAMM
MPSSPRLLMCPPLHFGVDYVINPWMQGRIGSAVPLRAQAQWDALHAALSALADIQTARPGPGLPDMPFAANAGLVLEDTFVVSRFLHPQRQGEAPLFADWFRERGWNVRELPAGIAFEGAGDALLDRAAPRLWLGHGHRSDAAAAPALADLLDIETIPLRLTDPRFYHLDTCFCPLQGGGLLYYPPAFDEPAQAAIAARVPAGQRIAVGEADALDFACNAISIGDTVVLNRASPGLRDALARAGFSVVEIALDEFLKAGGSAKCLTLRLDEPRLSETVAG